MTQIKISVKDIISVIKMAKFKVGDKVTFIGYDGAMSIDTVYDVWESRGGQWIELKQNEVALCPKKQKQLKLRKYTHHNI